MDEAKIAQQGAQISTHTDVTGRKWGTLMVEGIVIASGYVCEQCGVIGCRIQHPPPDTPARHGGSFGGPEGKGQRLACDESVQHLSVREGHGQDPAQDGAQAAAGSAIPTDAAAQPAGAQAAGGASQRETPASDGAIYWLDIDHDLRVVLDGCPVIIRRQGGTVVQIDPSATPAQRAELITQHVEAIEVSK